MSSDDNHGQAHMTPTARNICTSALFFTSSFNFGRQPFTLLLQDSIKEGFFRKEYRRAVRLWCVNGHTYVVWYAWC